MPSPMRVVSMQLDANLVNRPCVFEADARRFAYELVDEVVRDVAERILSGRNATALLIEVVRAEADAMIGKPSETP
jgi:hypothetical protein